MALRQAAWSLFVLAGPGLALLAGEGGLQPEERVAEPTRLDWKFAVRSLPPAGARVSAAYDSRAQRYQLFVPATYQAKKAWPLLVFVSPGDDPLGWRYFRKLCQDNEALFCAAYGAGNNSPPGRRVRLVLDVLDDVRRRYRIDPDRTYLAGFSGGAAPALAVAFALPEHFGGALALAGAGELPRLSYQRARARERLSVALLVGTSDPKHREVADYTAPLFAGLGVRTKFWAVPKLGHAMPPADVLAKAYAWLEEDVKRRHADAADRPGLAASPDEVRPPAELAASALALAEADLRRPERAGRGAALLEVIEARWGETGPGKKAAKRLREVRADRVLGARIKEQAAAEGGALLAARARAEERFGQARAALRTWRELIERHPGAPEAAKAKAEVKRLSAELARAPYLGATFAGDTTVVRDVVPGGPAARAGLRRGDEVLRLGPVKVGTLAGLGRAWRGQKPGDRVAVEVRRGGGSVALTVVVGATPVKE
jgi:hypothetical protein